MTQAPEVTIAGKRYANVAAHIQAVLGTLQTIAAGSGNEPVQVTVEPGAELDAEEIRALA